MRYLLGFLVTIGLIILIIFLLLTGGSKKSPTAKTLQLSDYLYSATTEASYTVDGPIQANQEHNTITINVSQSEVNATVYQGYDKTPIRTLNYPNNSSSFAVFMQALDRAGFSKGNTSKGMQDERGLCPTGQRTIFQLTDGSNSLMRFWKTGCGQGTFKGSISDVEYLFRNQIPDNDLSTLTQHVNAVL